MGADRWARAHGEHVQAVGAFVSLCERIAASDWHVAPAPGKWTPADVTLHLCHAYELGRDAATGGAAMRLRVTPFRARVLRTVVLPVILLTDRFPRGVPAPKEVAPDTAASAQLSRETALARLERAAQQAAKNLQLAAGEDPGARVTHAYFGALSHLAALRVLSAHTRHHTRALAWQSEHGRLSSRTPS